MLNYYCKDVMKIIRNYVTNKKIWVSIAKLTNTIRNFIANVTIQIY